MILQFKINSAKSLWLVDSHLVYKAEKMTASADKGTCSMKTTSRQSCLMQIGCNNAISAALYSTVF